MRRSGELFSRTKRRCVFSDVFCDATAAALHQRLQHFQRLTLHVRTFMLHAIGEMFDDIAHAVVIERAREFNEGFHGVHCANVSCSTVSQSAAR